jgi:replication factor C subunit 2/4
MEGLEALIFTSEGDMRQAVNNLQSTVSGFRFVNAENVFKVCDQPHPMAIQKCIEACQKKQVDDAYEIIDVLWKQGYSCIDLITTLFRVVKNMQNMPEFIKLEFIKEIGYTHMKVLEGSGSLLQLGGLIARLCRISMKDSDFQV